VPADQQFTSAVQWASCCSALCVSAFNKFTQAEAEMFRKFTHLMFR